MFGFFKRILGFDCSEKKENISASVGPRIQEGSGVEENSNSKLEHSLMIKKLETRELPVRSKNEAFSQLEVSSETSKEEGDMDQEDAISSQKTQSLKEEKKTLKIESAAKRIQKRKLSEQMNETQPKRKRRKKKSSANQKKMKTKKAQPDKIIEGKDLWYVKDILEFRNDPDGYNYKVGWWQGEKSWEPRDNLVQLEVFQEFERVRLEKKIAGKKVKKKKKKNKSKYVGVRLTKKGQFTAERNLGGTIYRSKVKTENEKEAAILSDALVYDFFKYGKTCAGCTLNFDTDSRFEKLLKELGTTVKVKVKFADGGKNVA